MLPLLKQRRRPILRHHRILHQHPPTRLQRPRQRPQNPHRIPIRPVVEDAPKQIHARPPHRLRLEETVAHEPHPPLQPRRRRAPGHRAGQVLYYEVELGEALGERDAGGAVGAAEVDDGAGAEGRPGVVGQEVGDVYADF